MTDAWRLFVAAAVPAATREALWSWTREWAGRDAGWRPVRPENIHLTLRFLGDTPSSVAGHLGETLAGAVPPEAPVALRVRGVGVFPGAHRPRVLWAGLEGELDRLVALAQRIEEWAVAQGFRRNARPFRAHMTVARAGRGRAEVPEAARAGTALSPDFGPLIVDRISLYRSHLGSGPPRHEALATIPLAEAAST
ncbi:MAG: RNA 2',3'-cyclic phosphodiesterase [Acidobacteriota bacterium]|nr:RNA 2',3'-cyclic phosphodiesterase [Acidobacteriota bacterium]